MTALPDIARTTADRHDMLPPGSVVLAMVSGGADSVALLRLLAAGELGPLGGLSVLHVNHLLRGQDADADEAFVASLAAEFDVPCEVVRYDVAAHAQAEGLNLEDAGRQVRYRFAEAALDARCAAAGVSPLRGRIAVAHTFDDRLETFLARLVAGSGPGGLRSISPARGRIVRPLLDARRADVTAYLTGLGQTWREDETNTDTSRQRAWVRHELLPLVEGRNPSFALTAARTLSILGEEDDLLAEMAEAFAHDLSRPEDGALVFERTFMRTLSRPMARRTVRRALQDAFPEASRLEFEHVEAVVDGIAEDGFARDLPGGLRAEAEYSTLRISRRAGSMLSVAPGLLELPGNADLGPGGSMSAREVAADLRLTDVDRVVIDADAVRWPLTVDAVREGDRIKPFGMDGTKKVGDLLTDEKVPRRLRSVTPVVRDRERVVWVAGVRLSEDYRVQADTTRVAELVWERPAARETDSGETREGR
jgi:tRNA(Ile)-lysidine synthase